MFRAALFIYQTTWRDENSPSATPQGVAQDSSELPHCPVLCHPRPHCGQRTRLPWKGDAELYAEAHTNVI